MKDLVEGVDRAAHGPVPFLVADLLSRLVAEKVLVALAAERVVAHLDVGHEPAVDEQGRAEAGAERDHELDAAAGDRAEALHVRVVQRPRGALESLLQLAREIEAEPLGMEVAFRAYYAVAHHAGEADGDAIELALFPREPLDDPEHGARRGLLRRVRAVRNREGPAALVHNDRLDAAAAYVDGQR